MPAPNIRFRAAAGPYAHRTDCLSTPTPPALRPNEFLEVLAQGQRTALVLNQSSLFSLIGRLDYNVVCFGIHDRAR